MFRYQFFQMALAALIAFSSLSSGACSTLMAQDSRGKQNWMGKNYDWHVGHGSLFVNSKNRQKKNTHPQSLTDFSWTSRYGNLTFSQFGREFPISGVNEKNLVVETLWLKESSFPAPQSHVLPVLNELQWVQYILDMSATVEEAIFNSKQIHIYPLQAQVHYFVCDEKECASFEYLNQKLEINRTGSEKKYSVLTNSPYSNSLKNLENYIDFGGQQSIPAGYGSYGRFARLASQLQAAPVMNNTQEMIDRLKTVISPNETQWTLIYNLDQKTVEFFTMASGSLKKINYGSLNYDCGSDTLVFDMDSQKSGDINSDLQKATPEYNSNLMLKNTYIPKNLLDIMIAYPDRYTSCLGSK